MMLFSIMLSPKASRIRDRCRLKCGWRQVLCSNRTLRIIYLFLTSVNSKIYRLIGMSLQAAYGLEDV